MTAAGARSTRLPVIRVELDPGQLQVLLTNPVALEGPGVAEVVVGVEFDREPDVRPVGVQPNPPTK